MNCSGNRIDGRGSCELLLLTPRKCFSKTALCGFYLSAPIKNLGLGTIKDLVLTEQFLHTAGLVELIHEYTSQKDATVNNLQLVFFLTLCEPGASLLIYKRDGQGLHGPLTCVLLRICQSQPRLLNQRLWGQHWAVQMTPQQVGPQTTWPLSFPLALTFYAS